MPAYESSGSLTTIEKSYSTPQTPDLTGLVYTLNGQSIDVDVVGSPGEAGEETVTQSLGGATSYDLSWSSAHSDFEVVFNLSTADDQVTPEVDDLTLVGAPNAPVLSVGDVTDSPSIGLSWPSESTADEYRIYRATSPGSTVGDYTQVDTTATVNYTDTAVSVGTTYYYRVTAVNTDRGESPESRERRARVSDDFTNSVAWNSEIEWGYGEFTNTTTDGSGTLELERLGSEVFDYSLNVANAVSASAEIRDANTSTVLASDSASGDSNSVSSTFTINTLNNPDLEFYVEVDDSSSTGGSGSASISLDGTSIVSVSSGGSETGTFTDTQQETYNYVDSGSWTSEYWDYTNTTTATKLSWSGVSLPSGGDDITVTVENADASSTHTETLTAGSGSALFEIAPNDTYRVVVNVSTGDNDTTPELGGVTLEAHSATTNHTVTASRDTELDLAWDEISVCDGYEVYQAESTPVTTSDTLAYSNTDSTVTTATITGLENGEQYYFNVRCVYSGE